MRISDWSSDVCSSDLNDVGAIALPREDAEHAEIGVALDREGDVLARNILQRVAKHLRVTFERRARIDIDGGADFLGDTRQRNIFGVHHAVTKFKMVHKQILIYAPFAQSLSKPVLSD